MDIKSRLKSVFSRKEEAVLVTVEGKAQAVSAIGLSEEGVIKTLSPDYLWKPPYGIPRYDDVVLERQLCRTAYIASIVWTLAQEVGTTDFEIRVKKQFMKDGKPVRDFSKDQERITEFFDNPNGNEESMGQLLQKVVTDILEIESGVLVKVFNQKGEMVQLMAVDGGTILKNPDEHGYFGNRDEFIPFTSVQYDPKERRYKQVQLFNGGKDLDAFNVKDRAAYFQFGNYIGFPIPFGRREIVYMSRNARTDLSYALPAAAILGDVLYTLIYGSAYNNAFYTNNNMPDGILEMVGSLEPQMKSFKEQFETKFIVKDGFGNKIKKFFKIHITNTPTKFTPFMIDPATMQVLQQQEWFIKLVWACFGIPGEEMGFTDSTHGKAVGEGQTAVHKRKAIAPLLRLIEYHMNTQVMPEFGVKELEFAFKQVDIDEEIKKQSLYALQLQNNLKTPNEIRAEEGLPPIDHELGNKTGMEKEQEQFEQQTAADKQNKPEQKSVASEEQALADPLDDFYREAEQKLLEAVEDLDKNMLERIR